MGYSEGNVFKRTSAVRVSELQFFNLYYMMAHDLVLCITISTWLAYVIGFAV
jgi:hypothetical protein